MRWLESWAYNRCEIKVSLLQLGLLWRLHVWTVKCQLRHQSLFQFINTCWYCLNVGFGVVRSKAALSSSDSNYPFMYWFSCHLSTVFLSPTTSSTSSVGILRHFQACKKTKSLWGVLALHWDLVNVRRVWKNLTRARLDVEESFQGLGMMISGWRKIPDPTAPWGPVSGSSLPFCLFWLVHFSLVSVEVDSELFWVKWYE